MKTERGIRISQCMIVKNEEKNIERALSWGREVMWEQIVVDTGSTDHTVELARKLGAKVFFFPWIDDFAAAKNYAISKAKGDWIAFLDADEYMMPEDTGKLLNLLCLLRQRGFDGLGTGWQQLDDNGQIFSSGTQVRFFRNDPDLRYCRRIHEQLVSVSGRKLRLGDAVDELSIFHDGYQTAASEKKKGRNRVLIEEELRENPKDHGMLGYMGDEYLGDEDREEAEVWYRRSIEQMPPKLEQNDQRSALTFANLLIILTERKGADWEQIRDVYEQAVKLMPEESDFDYITGCFFAREKEYDKAVQHLETAIHKLDTYGCGNKALLFAGNLLSAYDLLVQCCYELGEKQKCVNYAVACLKYDRYKMKALNCLIRTLLSDGAGQAEHEAVLNFLLKLYDTGILKDRLFLFKGAQRSERDGFADFVRDRLFTKEEAEQYGFHGDCDREGEEKRI